MKEINVRYQNQGNYQLPCIATKEQKNCISVRGQTVTDSILNNIIE